MSQHQPPQPGTDKHVLTENQWLAQVQQQFQHGNTPHPEQQHVAQQAIQFFTPEQFMQHLIHLYGQTLTENDLLALDTPVQRLLFNESQGVTRLVSEAHIPLADLLALDTPVQRLLFNESQKVTSALLSGDTTINELLSMDYGQLTEAIQNDDYHHLPGLNM